MASQINVAIDNVTSQCAKSSDNSYIYPYCITMVGLNTYVINIYILTQAED